MNRRPLGATGLRIAPIVFGGNVFGWTLDEAQSFRILYALVDAGFNAIDTADCYSMWAPGNQGGESEMIIGRWLAQNPAKRDKVLFFTKVGWMLSETKRGLSAARIAQAVEESLARLRIDVIDLYQAHLPDDTVPIEESLGAFQRLIEAGKVRTIGASNYDAAQLARALDAAREAGLPAYETWPDIVSTPVGDL